MIERGGKDEERLYLEDYKFFRGKEEVIIKKTDMPNIEAIIHRHKARYCLPAAFCRYQDVVLDFPCGSGYGYDIMGRTTLYEGLDIDAVTMEYCRKTRCNSIKTFRTMDMETPRLEKGKYNVIACIEGLEHIDGKFQAPLIAEFHNALQFCGRLIVTCPEADGKSGPSKTNPYHKHELTMKDFKDLIGSVFDNFVVVDMEDILHNGEKSNLMYAICKRGGYND